MSEQITEDDQQVEQITKEPEQKIERVKDPNKVAAGRRLAEHNKKAKLARKKENKHENYDEDDSKWMPEISFTTALSLVGITLTGIDLYYRWKKSTDKTTTKPKSNVDDEEPKPKIENEVNKPVSQQSKIPKRRI